MTWATRFKLAFGTLAVLVVVAAATYVYTERESTAVSQTATISAQQLPVGTDYGGKVVRQFVEEGDAVVEGDVLFTIESLQRKRDLEADAKSAIDEDDEDAKDFEASPLWSVTASADGTVAVLHVGPGGYVPSGGIVAEVVQDGSLEVTAELVLNPRDLDRLEGGASVELRLPDRSIVPGTVGDVQVATEGGNARAYVTVDSGEIAGSEPTGLTAPGTPVQVTVDLRDDGPLAGMRDSARDFLHRIGI
ncbi:HlyD family efflux transporter periplasmic adaptor subunit [Demequina oxidasica]|uniref:HlyD family efflux transporter periplasmic adaptor subunit n=1 Tax=Demequina oxidasica TaxID=676199 RepID=UPI000782EC5B|nr:HlyD family efflux transporter periplasmic adaptor subunit [Demequina oxidasica]